MNLHPPSKVNFNRSIVEVTPSVTHSTSAAQKWTCECMDPKAGVKVLKEGKPKKDVTRLLVYCTLRFVGGKCCGFFTDLLEP